MTNPETPPSQGLVAGKYQLVRLIGRGGMGSVWEARHASLGTPSAIKFIEAEYADSQEARSRFDKEAKAAATIQSKHAIQIYDHGMTEDGKPYIVMELLQGEPLDKVIERGPLSLQQVAKILQQVCRGLARAHERGIIHRDLKPENIFLVKTPDDDEAIAKVLDFGIAKMQGAQGTSGLTSSTKTGAVLGTPFYMSPEQARGLRNVDHRTDLWSLGVIAFKCVTGKLPFDGESVGDLLVKICTAPVPVPSQVAASLGIYGIPANFDGWFMRALEREPERRFGSAAELSDALCFAAGIQARSQQGAHSPHLAGMPGDGIAPPNHTGPSYPHPNGGYPGPKPHDHVGAPAGALTNAPFTREELAPVPSSKGKLVLGGVLAGVVAAATVVGVVLYTRGSVGARGAMTSGAAAITTAVSAEAPPASGTAPALVPTQAPEPAPAAKTAEGVAEPRSSARPAPPASPPKLAARPLAPPRTATASPPKIAPNPPLPPPGPTAPPVPPPKKPNKNDPGY